ncbi:MAG TPA: tyrosine-protein phosphatase [Gaiellaceae bacterium]|nr:tyrosine-protein phosphatase [Gaiellaceae bacterium]
MTVRPRELAWEGCLNVRDLGGLPTEDGGETRYGRVVRADSVRQLTDAGWQAVADYGLRTVVDLRGDYELRDDPPDKLPFEVVHVPFMEANEKEWDSIVGEIETAAAAAPDAVEATRDVYLIFLEHFRRNVAAGVRAVARAPEGGVVVHCVGGKDRTRVPAPSRRGRDRRHRRRLRAERGAPATAARALARRGRDRARAGATPAHRADASGVDGRSLRRARAPLWRSNGVPEQHRLERRGPRARSGAASGLLRRSLATPT